MSEKTARTHTSLTNRARARGATDRKVVFRSVVDNPFRISWPAIPLNLQNALLAAVVDMVEGVSQYNLSRESSSRKRRGRKNHNPRPSKRSKLGTAQEPTDSMDVTEDPHSETANVRSSATSGSISANVDAPTGSEIPEMVRHLVVGINEVTKTLEDLAHSNRQRLAAHTSTEGSKNIERPGPPSFVVLVCRGDVDPPILVNHFPNLVATCNSSRRQLASAEPTMNTTWLVPLPKGAETTLAQALGLRRAAAILVKSSAPKFDCILELLLNVPVVTAHWLTHSDGVGTLVPSHIKLLRTTAPKDMKAAKEQRVKGRAAAKERSKSLRSSLPKKVKLSGGPKDQSHAAGAQIMGQGLNPYYPL